MNSSNLIKKILTNPKGLRDSMLCVVIKEIKVEIMNLSFKWYKKGSINYPNKTQPQPY